MSHPLFFILTSCMLFHGLIIFAISSTINSPSENIAISCGSSGTPTALGGRVWVGDNTLSSTSPLHMSGKSWTSKAQQQKGSLVIDPVPYQTARISRHEFSYRFSVQPGQKFIRLHFNPAPYNGFKKSIALFTVKAGPYTLLSNFSPSITADALGVKYLKKEYCVHVQESKALTITFTPSQATKSSQDVYAFVNGIEIVSMPTGLYFTPEGDLGAHVVGQKHRFYIDIATALQMIQRFNIGGRSIPSIEDVSMFRDWKDDYNYLLNGVGAASIDTTITIEYAGMLTHVAPPKVYQTARCEALSSSRKSENGCPKKSVKLVLDDTDSEGHVQWSAIHFILAASLILRIVSNASSLIADYMEVDGGEESSTDWGIGRMLLPSNDPTTGHIVYPVANHRRELCDANRYQSCLPPGSPSKPIDCRNFRDRTC